MSVLNQSISDIELIVIDDASQDSTWDIIQSIAKSDKRIISLRNEKNLNSGLTRNRGIQHASGEWIAILDADDWFSPERLQFFMEYISEHDYDILGDNLILVDGKTDRNIGLMYDINDKMYENIITPEYFFQRNLPAEPGWTLGYVKPVIKRSFLEKNDVLYRPRVSRTEDFVFMVDCLLAGGRFKMLPSAHYHYRIFRHGAKSCEPATVEFLNELVSINTALGMHPLAGKYDGLHDAIEQHQKRLASLLNLQRAKTHLKNKEILQALNIIVREPFVLTKISRLFYSKKCKSHNA